MTTSRSLQNVQDSFRNQIRWVGELGAPFMVRLLETCLRQLNDGGGLCALIGEWPGNPTTDALPLRVTGALQALVLSEQAPDLASLYPPNPRLPDTTTLWSAISADTTAPTPAGKTIERVRVMRDCSRTRQYAAQPKCVKSARTAKK